MQVYLNNSQYDWSGYASCTKKIVSIAPVLPKGENPSVLPGVLCNLLNGKTIPAKARFRDALDNGLKYCSFEGGTPLSQKGTGDLCNNDFECQTNLCTDGVCTSLQETTSLLRKVWCALTNPVDFVNRPETYDAENDWWSCVLPPTPACTDSDGGQNIFTQGTVTGIGYGGIIPRINDVDSCYYDNKQVYENSCINGTPYFVFNVLPCPTNYICSNGACVQNNTNKTNTTRCTDSDGGQNIYVAGTAVNITGLSYTDYCKNQSNSTRLQEAYCWNNSVNYAAYTEMSCPTGTACQNGACINTCTPNCINKTCGSNGCGGTCGTCATGQTCTNGRCVTPATCTDTDGGQNYWLKGKITSAQYPNGKWDECATYNNKVLKENYCVGSSSSITSKNCGNFGMEYTCQNGACAFVPCTDSDNGANFLTYGKVVSSLYPQGKWDFCTNVSGEQYLYEGTCRYSANFSAYTTVRQRCKDLGPDYICTNGVCKNCGWQIANATRYCIDSNRDDSIIDDSRAAPYRNTCTGEVQVRVLENCSTQLGTYTGDPRTCLVESSGRVHCGEACTPGEAAVMCSGGWFRKYICTLNPADGLGYFSTFGGDLTACPVGTTCQGGKWCK